VANPTNGAAKSTTTAATHSPARAGPWAKPPASQRAAPAPRQTRIRWKFRRSSFPRRKAATTNSGRATSIAAYMAAKTNPRPPKASGNDADMTRLASMIPTSSSRTAG